MEYTTILDYLEQRIQKDEAFLLNHQDELDPGDPEQKEIYEVVAGKIDMCRQILGYLEEIRKYPGVVTEDLR